MAEYKNGVNFMGILSVDKEDVTPEIQTGRAVFVDDEKYDSDSTYAARVDKYVAEGFHRINKSGSSGGGEGGGLAPLIVHYPDEDSLNLQTDRTWNEVHDAWEEGRPVYLHRTYEGGNRGYLLGVYDIEGYSAVFLIPNQNMDTNEYETTIVWLHASPSSDPDSFLKLPIG